MRILKVSQTYYPFLAEGGRPAKVSAIAKHLVRLGHQVSVLSVDFGIRSVEHHFDSLQPCPWGWRAEKDGVEIIYLHPIFRYRTLTWNGGLARYCKEQLPSFDLAHIYGLYDFLGPMLASHCRRLHVPYVVEPLGMTRPIDRNFVLKRIWHRIFGAALLRNAARLIATSEQEHRELSEDGIPRERVLLRYNGIELEEYKSLPTRGTFRAQSRIAPEERIILFVGRLIPRKGVDLLIAAFAEVCSVGGQLVVAGPEGERGYLRRLQELAKARGVAERVHFVGPLFGEQKLAAMRDSDLFVLPSEYENFANSVAEAIACGIPAIVTDRCGISEFVEGKAGLVIPRTPSALADALRRLLSDHSLYARFQSRCPEVAANLDWDALLRPMVGLYEELRRKQV